MKGIVKIVLSVFFAIAIGIHIKDVIDGGDRPFWWHGLYFVSYGVCWWMVFSENKWRAWVFGSMALFPFSTHLYYGYRHFGALDLMFWVCVLVCVLLIFGFFWLRNETLTFSQTLPSDSDFSLQK